MSSEQTSPAPRPASEVFKAACGAAIAWLTPGSGEPASAAAGRRRSEPQHGWLRRHWILASVVALVLVVSGSVAGWFVYLNQQIASIERIPLTLDDAERPARIEGEALNILIAGADNGTGPTIADDVAAGRWEPGSHRSDTIMILHLPADRDEAFLVSIPRDSYVKLYDERGDYTYTDKINAAFSLYGPSGYIATIEHLTGLRMDHLAIMDWQGFKDVSHAIGGVRVYIPETFYDESQKVTWQKGWDELEGQEALQYVRTRHGLTNGDFDRIARQQNFLRSMMQTLLSDGVMRSPTSLTGALKAITSNLTVDESWSTGDIRDLALSLRDIEAENVTFVTAPLGSYDTTSSGQSIVRLDPTKSKELWRALGDGALNDYVATHKGDALPDARKVS